MVTKTELELIKGKERRKYAKTHGIDKLINIYHGLPWNDEKAEKVYKICNDKNISWEEYYGIKERDLIH